MADAEFGFLTPANLALFTDRYELTMQQGYRAVGHAPRATFQLFFRDLPPHRGYVVAAGLEQVVAYLTDLSVSERAVAHLAEEGFDEDFLAWLADFEFTGDVRAVPEGTPVFPDEPLVEVTAPIEQGQLFETMLINQVGLGSLLATKAARMREAVERHGDGQRLVEFGSRRAHGTDAGIKAARSAYVGGFDATSNEAAGELFDLPVVGTMAHSWVQSFPSERAAFEAYVDVYGEDSVLLVDTYDTLAGAETALDVARESGVDVSGVRLDSGDLAALSREVRALLPEEMEVFVSSGMDEYAISDFFRDGGVADGFGPGTALATSADAPKMEGVYKLVAVEDDGELAPSMKLSSGKATHPGRKSVYRVAGPGGYERDVIAERDEDVDEPGAEQLLVDVIRDGELVYDLPDLDAIRERALAARRRLPEAVRALEDPAAYPVAVSDGLAATTRQVEADLRERTGR